MFSSGHHFRRHIVPFSYIILMAFYQQLWLLYYLPQGLRYMSLIFYINFVHQVSTVKLLFFLL